MTTVSFSIGEALGFGWRTFKAHAWLILAAMIGLFGLSFALEWGFEAAFGEQSPASFLFSTLVGTVMGFCFSSFFLDLIETGTPDFQALFSRMTPKKLLNMLAYSLAVGLLFMVGCLLLVVPGLVFATMFSQGGFLILDKDMNFLQALQESAKITKGAKVDLFMFGLACFGLILLGVVALVVGAVPAIAVIGVAQAYIYRELRPKLDATPPHAVAAP